MRTKLSREQSQQREVRITSKGPFIDLFQPQGWKRDFAEGWGRCRPQRAESIASAIAFPERWREFHQQQPLPQFTLKIPSRYPILNYSEKILVLKKLPSVGLVSRREGNLQRWAKVVCQQLRASGQALSWGRQKLSVTHTEPCSSKEV